VKVEDHVDALHLGEDGVVHGVALHADAALRVGRDAARVALDADDAALLGLADVGRGEVGRQVERGEDGERGGEGLELLGVGDRVLGEGERRHEVRL